MMTASASRTSGSALPLSGGSLRRLRTPPPCARRARHAPRTGRGLQPPPV